MKDQHSKDIWNDCKLGRETDAMIIAKFVDNTLAQKKAAGKTQSLVLNLDAPWGGGKTFFLGLFKQHLERSGNVVAYVDAWRDDHSRDPFLTVVDELISAFSSRLPAQKRIEKTENFFAASCKVAGSAAWATGKHLLSRYLGKEAVGLLNGDLEANEPKTDTKDSKLESEKTKDDRELEKGFEAGIRKATECAGDEVMKSFQVAKSVRRAFHDELTVLAASVNELNETKSPIYVIIDELDRCRPDYAIELLESIKHLFSVDGLVFILATDSKQLVRAVKGVFGSEIDGSRYLERFVDRTYKFQETSMSDFIDVTVGSLGMKITNYFDVAGVPAIEFWAHIFKEASISLRAAEKILGIMSTFEAAWPYSESQISPVILLNETARLYFPKSEFDKVCKVCMSFRQFNRSPRNQGPTTSELNLQTMARLIDNGYRNPEQVGGGTTYHNSAQNFLIASHNERMRPTRYGFPTENTEVSEQYRQILARVVKSID